MANRVQPTESHSYLVSGISGPDGADRMYVTAGSFPGGEFGDFYALIEPHLEPGQFRRALATAGMSGFSLRLVPPPLGSTPMPGGAYWYVSDVDADWDDESGQVQFHYTTAGSVAGIEYVSARIERIAFQVITFAAPPQGD